MSLVALVLLPLLLSPTLSIPVGFGSVFDYGYDLINGYDSAADYYASGYPRTLEYNKDNFVRGLPYGATEIGTRDEFTVRPKNWRAPYSRFYSSYYPGINRFPFVSGNDYQNGLYGYSYAADNAYTGSPPNVDFAKEDYIRESSYGQTEIGTRDQLTVRPKSLRFPYSIFYPWNYPYSRGFKRYPYDYDLRGSFPFGSYLPRSPYLGKFPGDALSMK